MNLVEMLVDEARDNGFKARDYNDIVNIWLSGRKVYKSEVIEALDLYDHEVFVRQDGNMVIIDLS